MLPKEMVVRRGVPVVVVGVGGGGGGGCGCGGDKGISVSGDCMKPNNYNCEVLKDLGNNSYFGSGLNQIGTYARKIHVVFFVCSKKRCFCNSSGKATVKGQWACKVQ